MTIDRERLRWNGWGRQGTSYELGDRADAVWGWLAQTLGLEELPETPAVPLEEIELPPVRLTEADLTDLAALTDPQRVHTDGYERAFHAKGASYHDLIQLRDGEVGPTPDVVVYPKTPSEVVALLDWAAQADVAVVPFGGGTSVVGGVEAQAGEHRAVVTCDTTHLDALVEVDREAMTATLQAGIYGPALEEALASHGLTLGHYPQSFEFSTLGGWIATRGAGQQSNKYGKAEDWLVAAELATPEGLWRTRPAPASAAGPEVEDLVAGSEGVLGIITRATVKVHPAPETRDYRGWLFESFEAGVAAVRALVQQGVPAAMVRLLDEDETRFLQALSSAGREKGVVQRAIDAYLALRGYDDTPCLLLLGAEGGRVEVKVTMARAFAVARRHGGLYLGARPGRSWYEDRFALPYLRDPLLDRGLAVDTLETATTWSNLLELRQAVTAALRGALDAVVEPESARRFSMCHVSHAYHEGASLYFTYLWPRDLEDPVGQWRRIKKAASQAIVDHGGTISHHHGVGADHRSWLVEEKGEAGMAWLEAIKDATDPEGVLNPGKLVDP